MKIDPVDIVFLYRVEGHKVGDKFPDYFIYHYNSSPDMLLEKSFRNNLVEISYSTEKTLEYMKTIKVKEILKLYNQKITGNKQDLIERIISNVSEEEIKKHISDKYYSLTDKGWEIINNNEHIIYYHKSDYLKLSGINLEDYHALLKESKDLNDKYDIAVKLICSVAEKNKNRGDWGLYSNCLRSKAKIFEDMQLLKQAIKIYLMVCCFDLSGMSNNNLFLPKAITLAPGIIDALRGLVDRVEIKEAELRDMYCIAEKELGLPRYRYSNEESFTYITKALDGKLDEVNMALVKTNEDYA